MTLDEANKAIREAAITLLNLGVLSESKRAELAYALGMTSN